MEVKNKMPGRDGTGPLGLGPRTGRGMGPCGRGLGRGFRGGFGRGYGRNAQMQTVELSKEEQKKIVLILGMAEISIRF